ncbi:hypothetical protein ACQWKR_24440, partial [Salmonella enterica subsp. enterica serovar Infantis]
VFLCGFFYYVLKTAQFYFKNCFAFFMGFLFLGFCFFVLMGLKFLFLKLKFGWCLLFNCLLYFILF